jgi:hypothetical protein
MLRIRQVIVNIKPFIRTLTDIIDVTGALTDNPNIPTFKMTILYKGLIPGDTTDQPALKLVPLLLETKIRQLQHQGI